MKKINSKGFDYVNENLIFKIRKVMRYIKLYGISRTIIKVKGQYHMQKNSKTTHHIIFQITQKKISQLLDAEILHTVI